MITPFVPASAPEQIARQLLRLYRRRVLSCEMIAQGWEADVYGFSLAPSTPAALARGDAPGRRRPRELVLKLYLGDLAADKCAREGRMMSALEPHGVPVPAVRRRGLANGGSPFEVPYLIMERFRGRAAGELWAAAADESERGALLHLFCRLLAGLHALDWRQVAAEPPPPFDTASPTGFVEHALAAAAGDIARFDQPAFAPVVAWLRRRSAGAACPRLAVLHGDYHESNLLVADDGTPSIVDWCGARVGDPRWDLAWTLLLIDGGGSPPGFRDAFLGEYGRLAGGPVEHLDYFDALVALRRLLNATIAASHGAAVLGLRPGAEQAMRSDPARLLAARDRIQALTGVALPVPPITKD